MSGMMHPVGPQPPSVYWVRRVLVVVVVLALLLGVRWLLTGRSSSSPSAAPSASPTVSPTTTPTSSAPSTSPTPTSSPTTSPSGSASAGGPCADAAISVTASTDAASYPVGSTPKLRMKIQNTSASSCKRDVGAAANELVITSGTVHVWSSDDCSPGGASDVVLLAPGQSYSVSVTWLGRLSSKGCPTNQPLAQKGSYKLVGRNGTVSSAGATFVLT